MNVISALSSIATLLGGDATSDFKKLAQPRGLVAASIFLALNLTVVLPNLASANVRAAVLYAALPAAWQVATGTLALFALGYLINSLGPFFLSIVSGSTLLRSPVLGRLLVWFQQRRFDRLRETVKARAATPNDLELGRAAFRLAHEFPDERDAVAPTGLGNVLLSTASYVRRQFGTHLDTVLPLLAPGLKGGNADLEAQLRERHESLQFLCALFTLLLTVMAEVILTTLVRPPRFPWAELAFLAVGATSVYLAATQTARAWGNDVRNAFLLYLGKAEDLLGLRPLPPEALEARRKRWEAVSEWIVYGGLAMPEDQDEHPLLTARHPVADWYREVPPGSELPVRAPSGVRVEPASEWVRLTRVEGARGWAGTELRYRLMVRVEGSASAVSGCVLQVKDPRLSVVPDEVKGRIWSVDHAATPEALVGRKSLGDTLLWMLGDLPANSSHVLHYEVPVSQVSAELTPEQFQLTDIRVEESGNLVLQVEASSEAAPEELHLTLTSPGGPLKPTLAMASLNKTPFQLMKKEDASKQESALRWVLPGVPPGARIIMSIKEILAQKEDAHAS